MGRVLKRFIHYLPTTKSTKSLTKKTSLKQENTIANYIEEFNKIMNKVRNMSEEDKIEYFISGLQPETGKKV